LNSHCNPDANPAEGVIEDCPGELLMGYRITESVGEGRKVFIFLGFPQGKLLLISELIRKYRLRICGQKAPKVPPKCTQSFLIPVLYSSQLAL
jgi:hypothetical protein